MASTTEFYQTVGFHFAVSFKTKDFQALDARFQSVSGLNAQIETERLKEGGENRYTHELPARRKFSDLVLKRGVLSPEVGSKITEWCINAFQHFGQADQNSPKRLFIEPVNLEIVLLNEDHEALMKWKVIHAWPKAWKFGDLHAEKSEVLIETLELHYNYFEFTKP